jgi:hypothetical protein
MNEAVASAIGQVQDSINEAKKYAQQIPVGNLTEKNVYYAIQALAKACEHLVDAVSNLEDSNG